MDKNEVLQTESIYQFEEFKHEDAWHLGVNILKEVRDRELRRVGIRFVFDGVIIFQYLMDGKNEDQWARRKENVVLESGHSSYYVFLDQENQPFVNDETHVVCGGGYPIIVQGEVRGCITVSGQRDHVDDHQLIINALERYFKQ